MNNYRSRRFLIILILIAFNFIAPFIIGTTAVFLAPKHVPLFMQLLQTLGFSATTPLLIGVIGAWIAGKGAQDFIRSKKETKL